jgi:1-hydroxycarotenoid 3,4-desaturase
MTDAPVVVIGAGIAGLAAALRLLGAGREVILVEGAATAGGKMRQVETMCGPVDSGPTVFTMRAVFDELLAGVGADLDDVVAARPLELLARHAWDDTAYLDLFADREHSEQAIGDFAGAAEARAYRAFCREAGQMFRVLETSMLRAPRPNPLSLAWRARGHGMAALLALKPFTSLWQALGEHFADGRLRQLFGRYSTYCGSSPWQAPATLMLIAHLEQEGVWTLRGGMQALADGLADVLVGKGCRFIREEWVTDIRRDQGRACAVITDQGRELACDGIVCTADPEALRLGLLGESARAAVPRRPSGERSLSAMTWSSSARATGFPLAYHNVFFSTDYRREFDRLFQAGLVPDEPTVYLCAQDREQADAVPLRGPERVFCLINAPANGDRHSYSPEEIAICQQQTFRKLAACGLQIEPETGQMVVRTPTDFARRFPGSGGAIYGRATHGWQAAFRRPGSRTRLPGLYLAGGGVHPGAGVPMVALSGSMAADSLLSDQLSMRRWWPGVTAGGTSTR